MQKCELEVLLGLQPEQWSRIRQIVIEVHDIAGRLEVTQTLLASQGFSVIVEQDALYEGTVMYNLYATRPST